MNDNLKMLIWAIIIIGVVFLMTNIQKPEQNLGAVGYSNVFYADNATTTENGSAWLSTAASEILYRDDNRQFVRLSLDENATTTAYVRIWQATSTDLVTTNGGIPLSASTTPYYEIDADNLYRGEIQGIATGDVQIFWIAQ